MKKILATAMAALSLLAACAVESSADAGTCYNSDNQPDKSYKSSFECKKGGGTWK